MKPYYADNLVTIYNADCREVLSSLPRVDLVLTDPPYGVDKASWDGYAQFRGLIHSFGAVCPLVVNETGIVIVFCATRYLNDVVNAIDLPYRWQFIWACSNNMIPGALGFAKYTSALMFSERESLHANAQDLRDYPAGTTDLRTAGHPTPKPLPLMRYLTLKFSPEAGSILDPFMGVGTSLIAAKELGRHAIGIEIEEKYCEIAARRLEVAQPALFTAPTKERQEQSSCFQ